MYIYIYVYIYTRIYVYIYIYIYGMHYVHCCMYMYIYICSHGQDVEPFWCIFSFRHAPSSRALREVFSPRPRDGAYGVGVSAGQVLGRHSHGEPMGNG